MKAEVWRERQIIEQATKPATSLDVRFCGKHGEWPKSTNRCTAPEGGLDSNHASVLPSGPRLL